MTLIERLVAAHDKSPPETGLLLKGDTPWNGTNTHLVDAAVLVAMTDRLEPGIILTKRPDTMRKHAGQVAFPGGRVDRDDASIEAAALREAHEEIALDPALPQLMGFGDCYQTITDYRITPVLALIPPDLPLLANEDEVEAIFEVPLSFLLDPANHAKVERDWHGGKRHYYEMHWDGFRIWGATAAMIVNLSRRLSWSG